MKRLLPLLAACAVLAAPARAQAPAAPRPAADRTLLGHAPGQFPLPHPLDFAALLPPPPAAGSPTAKIELDQIFALQQSRTPEQAARCVQIENETLWLFGSEVLGSWFTEANLPKTAAFFARVREDFIAVNRAAKALHPRQRPPFVDERIKPCVEFKDTGAYPSGHGIQSSLWAGLLGEILPEHKDGFILRAAVTRNFKAISGVHYPSDLAAGQAVGEALARELLLNPDVQKALAEVRAEVTAQAAKPPVAAAPVRPRSTSASLSGPINPAAAGKIKNIGIAGRDVRWAEHGEYLTDVAERIQAKWYALLGESKITPPRGSHVTVTFSLNSKGETEMVKVEDSGSGKDGVFACQNAITWPQPYRPWTKEMIAALGESQELTFSFHYQ